MKVEHAVGALVPKRDWTIVSHRVIFHGRRVCHSRKPACGACTLAADCPSYGTADAIRRRPRRWSRARAGSGCCGWPAHPDAPRRPAPVDDPRALDAGADPVGAAADVALTCAPGSARRGRRC